MLFIKIINRIGRGEVERAEINLLRTVFTFDQEWQALSAADERACFIHGALVINEQRTGDRQPARLAFTYVGGLLVDAGLSFRRQGLNRFAEGGRFDGEDREVVMTAATAPGAAIEMRGVARRQPLGQPIYLSYETLILS